MTISHSISAALACALALAFALAGAACVIADNRMDWKVCSNGNLCPLDTQCSASGEQCLLSCGDRVVDPGDECDDGNLRDGDGCDHNCTATACGNNVVSLDEVCDDGNTRDGDACRGDCLELCPERSCHNRPAGAIKRVPAKLPDPCEGDPDC